MNDAPTANGRPAPLDIRPSAIPMPDSTVRLTWWWQLYCRWARPTLDWVTVAAVAWAMIVQPAVTARFDAAEAGMALCWAATVYGFRTAEKLKGVA